MASVDGGTEAGLRAAGLGESSSMRGAPSRQRFPQASVGLHWQPASNGMVQQPAASPLEAVSLQTRSAERPLSGWRFSGGKQCLHRDVQVVFDEQVVNSLADEHTRALV